MTTATETLFAIAVLKAAPGKRETLREALLSLIEPTRREAGNLDYVLFEQREESGTFYMREAFANQAAWDERLAAPYFRAFVDRTCELLAEPIRLIFLDRVSS